MSELKYKKILSMICKLMPPIFFNETNTLTISQAAEQVVIFLKNFYKVFPEFSKIDVSICKSNSVLSHHHPRELNLTHFFLAQTYLAGESFAGQYIPYFAQAILDTAALSIPLLGLIMGNPWINPKIQYLSYLGESQLWPCLTIPLWFRQMCSNCVQIKTQISPTREVSLSKVHRAPWKLKHPFINAQRRSRNQRSPNGSWWILAKLLCNPSQMLARKCWWTVCFVLD